MRIHAMTKKGTCKNENEDRILVNNEIISDGYSEFVSDSIIVAIADGVGGNCGGATASEFITYHLSKSNHECIDINLFKDINDMLISRSRENSLLNNMATTLSGFSIKDGNAKLFHIGNTRINIMQGSYIKQITDDHTTVNWLIKTGKLTTTDAENFNKRNEITACLGGGNTKLISQLVFADGNSEIENSSKVIITSDGIHEYVSIDELEYCLNKSVQIIDICRKIIEKAEENGSQDDRSIIIILK